MSAPGILIVGGGQSAVQLAASLRQEGHAGDITLVGEEPGLPYQRPPLSKAYMKDGDAERLVLKSHGFFETQRIDRREGLRVTAIDRARREAVCENGERLAYDHLVLATGAANVRPPVEGADHESVLELRTLHHAGTIRARLAGAERAVVVGGGFIGLEFAAMARAGGVEVTVIEAGERVMARAVSPAMSAHFLALHREQGIEILLGAKAARIETGTRGTADSVVLADGRTVAGDMVLLAAGVRPNTALAEAAGLATDNGIVVDETLATSDPAIHAIGDCASVHAGDGTRCRLESVQAATDQARHLARRLAGHPAAPYRAVPWFWSDQGVAKLQIAGLSASVDRWHEVAGEGASLTVLGFCGERLVCVETVNLPAQHMAARKLLGRDRPPSYDELAGAGFDLRAFAARQAAETASA